MKFVISSSALLSFLSTASKVISSKNTLPILDYFLFEVKDGSLKVTASDLETTITSTIIPESVESEGVIAAPVKLLIDSLKEFSEQPLTFEADEEKWEIKISWKTGSIALPGTSGMSYPAAQPLADDAQELTFDVDVLLGGINRTIFATADDELRPVMNGVYFDIQADNLTFVSTDGHKLVRNRNYGIKDHQPAAFILPKKPATILKNLLPKESDDVTLKFNERNAYITMESSRLICRLIEGRYPNYNSVIPQNNPYRVTVDRLTLLSALKRVLIFSNQSSALIKLHLESNQLVVSGQDIDYSTSAEERVPCEYGDSPMNIGFKGTFLIDILNNMGGENVIIELADPSRAGVIVPAEQEENEDLLMLLMPMMLND